jgi:hypothetical protein
MKIFFALLLSMLSAILNLKAQETTSGQFYYVSTVSSLDTSLGAFPNEDFIIQIFENKAALVKIDTFSNVLLSRIIKYDSDT